MDPDLAISWDTKSNFKVETFSQLLPAKCAFNITITS